MQKERQEVIRLQQEWLSGGSALPLVQLYIERNELDDAATVGRAALSMDRCPDAEQIESLLATLESTPAGWDSAIETFVADPSAEHWKRIIRFAPPDLVYAWVRKAFRQIARRGGTGDALIRYGTQCGITPDVMEIVDRGHVEPETLIARGEEAGAARAFWLGLAAQAAYQRGNRFRAVALLREAWSCADEYSTPGYSVMFLRDHGDPELEEMMRSAGVWEIRG
jgi:hypothetical protein